MDLWTCGPVDSVDVWALWTYEPVDVWTLWTCGPVDLWTSGRVDSVDLWTCGLCGRVDSVDLWTLWTLWTCGLCGPMDLWTLWTCGRVDSVDVWTRWTFVLEATDLPTNLIIAQFLLLFGLLAFETISLKSPFGNNLGKLCIETEVIYSSVMTYTVLRYLQKQPKLAYFCPQMVLEHGIINLDHQPLFKEMSPPSSTRRE